MKRVWRSAVVLALCLCLLSACGAQKTNLGIASTASSGTHKTTVTGSYETGGLTVTDYFGKQTTLTKKPEYAAILSGTPLNIWYDLGGKSVCTSEIADGNLKLVAEHRDEMLALPTVGAVYALNMEAVIAQKPDFIVTQAGVQSKETETLRNMDYPVVSVLVRSFDDLVDVYRLFGAILDVSDAAEEKIAALTAERSDLIAQAPKEGKSVVILYLTASALSVKLDNSIAGDVANSLGIKNIASNLAPDTIGSENAPLDIEYLVEQNPDIVLVTSMIASDESAVKTMEQHFAENPAWKTVPAVAAGRVYYLPQKYFLYHAGPYYNEAIRYMACTVYPEIYGEVSDWYEE